ncbi:MAG TPA: SigB/SigF/SigG family RNA polymerase sigma factor [Candidatus Xenobia bacterium]|jgi:RNA polymerase sigma-B factor
MGAESKVQTEKWNKEKVRELFAEYRYNRDVAIRDRLVMMHTNLVRYIAAKFSNRGEALDDLYQVGCLGLMKAIERYDTERGAEFTTYATPTIIGEIKRYFRDRGWALKVPRKLQELKASVSRVADEFMNQHGRMPTVQQIAERLKCTEEEVLEAQELGQVFNLLSLNSGADNDDDKKVSNLLDYLGVPDLRLENVDNRVTLERALTALARREQLVIFLRFYQNMSQSDIAKILQISQMHVSRLQAKALERMKQFLLEPEKKN